jgi:uncharacterized protein (TIGR03084 family)
MSPVEMPELLGDLADEHADLDAVVAALDEEGWDISTPAEGWAVRDQVSHLAFFDEAATMAISEPKRFSAAAEAAVAVSARGGDPMAEHLGRGRAMTGAELLRWWRSARAGLLGASRGLSVGDRVPWYGPPMSAASFVSARLMETWAHGQDVADAVGAPRRPTSRLRHVAQIGVRARPFSFVVRGLEPPQAAVRVELEGPDGEQWTWDETAEGEEVRGPALDFCLVVTQRRHLADAELVVTGEVARQWMAIAQAFAGPPGPGRQPTTAR